MIIVYLGSFRLPNYDAAATRVLNVARALRLAGHEVSFISWGGKQRECDLCPDGKYRYDGFEYVVTDELDPKGNILQKVICKLQRGNKTEQLLEERIGNFDAVITYNGSLTRWLLRFAKKHQVKLINDITEWYDYNELKVTDWLPYAYNMHCTQKRVKNKIVISKFLDDYYNTTHNIVVPATCDASEAKWQQGAAKAKEKAGEFDGITLIYAGNPARKDAVHYAINAVQRLIDEGENVRFLIVGAERERYLKSYADLLSKKELSERIQFMGRVSQDEVPSYYALADFMVLLREPTRKSNAGFPTKFSESFTSRTPVIANLTSDLRYYLFDGDTGFIVKEPTEAAIYETIKRRVMVLSREKIVAMKQNVKEEAKRLDYHAYVESLREYMDHLK